MVIVIREFLEKDVLSIQTIYREAFKGFPWFENLTDEEVQIRWQRQSTKKCFSCVVAEVDERLVGATWWDTISPEQLLVERGIRLADFVGNFYGFDLVWLRETCVRPKYQGQGIAQALKLAVIGKLAILNKPILLLTRMREDNLPIISINRKLGFKRTGIKVPSSQIAGVYHEYWYKKQ